ncbi:MAG: EAL domain-containing protein [Lachnospiraceae bacterium]|nr:EAL domain-containing protein [Lachnospiraceae bacterium]
MLNIEVQMCGLVIDLLLIYFASKHDRVGLYSERIFLLSIVLNTLCVILDISSIFVIVNSDKLPTLLVDAVSKLYLVFLVTVSYMAMVYTFSDIPKLKMSKKFRYAQFIVFFIGAIVILALPISYYHEGRVIYSYGPADVATYIFAPYFIISTLLFTIYYSKTLNRHRKKAVRAWMMLEIIAAGIQFINPGLLLVGFGSATGLTILYAELENPEAYLDRLTGIFSTATLWEYLKQLYINKTPFSTIVITTPAEWKLAADVENDILIEMTNFLRSFPNAKLFRCTGNSFMLIYDKNRSDSYEIESAFNLDIIKQTFEKDWHGQSEHIPAVFMYAPDSLVFESSEEFYAVYQYYKDDTGDEENTILLNAETGSHIREFQQMVNLIKDAIAEDRVEVFYQPIYSIADKKFVSAEALARLRDRDGGIVMPGRFIPVAEEYGLIEKIGERVFEKTCHALKDSHMRKHGIQYVEINLSVAQCENEKLADNFKNIMKELGLPPETINLEITETSTLNQRNILLDNMHNLKELGCTFSLDDFGTGESNLNYIVDMPVDIVKFDRTMTQEYFTNSRAKVVMSATIRMIKELGLKIVAEGIETKEQLDSMAALGVDYIQGFYFSKPLPHNEFISFIQAKN